MSTPVAAGTGGGGHAEVREEHMLQAMSWWDGFMIALANPGFLLAALGGSIGALGTLGALVIWTLSVCLGALQNNIYAELACMFPHRSGGITVYAHEAWRRYTTFVGPLAAFGYWFAWSSVLSISGLIAGTLIHAEWFADTTWSADAGHFHLDLPVLIAIGFLCLVWFFNARGIRATVVFSYVTGILLLVPIVFLMFIPYLSGDWASANMDWDIGANGGLALVITWLYFMGWSSYGFEAVATIAPEFRDIDSDAPRALRASAAFSVVIYALFPLGIGGTLGTQAVVDDPTLIVFYKTAFDAVGGEFIGSLLVICLVIGIVLTMSTATMDGSRALYGISRSGMTIKALGTLNKHRVPGRGMALDAAINIFLVVYFGTAIEILAAGNFGYMLAHVFALTGFILLRRDRPNWPRPLKLASVWLPIAGVLAALNLIFVVLGGFVFADEYGYGLSKTFLGVAVLFVSILLFVYRRVVEDKTGVPMREDAPAEPSAEELNEMLVATGGSPSAALATAARV
jgi:amino acid transporter